jgi:hypothetical protein
VLWLTNDGKQAAIVEKDFAWWDKYDILLDEMR